MTEEKIGEVIIQMDWVCQRCRRRNPGLEGPEDDSMKCAGCGSPKSVEEYLAPEDVQTAAEVTDGRLLELAKAGPNWVCAYCKNEERGGEKSCSSCGAPREESSGSLQPTAATSETQEDEASGRRTPWAVISAVAGAAVLIGFILHHLLAKHETTVTVSSSRWERIERLYQKQRGSTSDWENNLPPESFNKSCEVRTRTYVSCEPFKCNPHRVSYECNCRGGETYSCNSRTVRKNCRSQNNGSMKCDSVRVSDTCRKPKTCSTCYRTEHDTCYKQCPVRDQWCRADFYHWPEVDSRVLKGGGSERPRWPGLAARGPEERLQRFEVYTLEFSDGEEKWDYRTESEAEFLRFPLGTPHRAEYSLSGSFRPL